MQNTAETTPKPIMGFQDEYRWLSNFWESPITVIGMKYRNVESAYQASKTINIDYRMTFEDMSGAEAKRAGSSAFLRPDWDFLKLEIMELCLRAKFMTHKDLAEKLIATGSVDIIELNTWGDTTWGQIETKDGKLTGDNLLGKLLMNIRSDIK